MNLKDILDMVDKGTTIAAALNVNPAFNAADLLLDAVRSGMKAYEATQDGPVDWSQLKPQRHAIPPSEAPE